MYSFSSLRGVIVLAIAETPDNGPIGIYQRTIYYYFYHNVHHHHIFLLIYSLFFLDISPEMQHWAKMD